MRKSVKRDCILRIVRENKIHGTAEQIYELAKKEIPEISLATVYRNLNLLSEQGVIKRLTMKDQSERYDGTIADHSHLFCTKCGSVFDLEYNITRSVMDYAKAKLGFACQEAELTARGICKNCRT